MSNTFRKQYRQLTVGEKEHIEQIKDAAERLERLIDPMQVSHLHENARYLKLAITALEESVMWATKGLT